MLKVSPRRGVALFGSTSEIGSAILKEITPSRNTPLVLIGREASSKDSFVAWPGEVTFIHCDLRNTEQIREAFRVLNERFEIDFAVLASAHLPPENCETNFDSVQETFSVNSTGVALALSSFVSHMNSLGGTILYLSSVASIRPRTKNFTYGASKRSADFFALGLASKYQQSEIKIKIARLGFVYTKLSKGYEVAPFPTTPEKVARDCIHGINQHKTIIYSPRVLRLLMSVVRILPVRIFRRL
jgi:decaprenylphospho-beta-D-erythro-pentofuranosid-2-ulose 2-reductase